MNFLLPRLVLLAIMLAASMWALLDQPAHAIGETDPVCADAVAEPFAVETKTGHDSALQSRPIRWQNFLPGTLR